MFTVPSCPRHDNCFFYIGFRCAKFITMSVKIPCPFCDGTGSANNPRAFYKEGEIPDVSENCKVCAGSGSLEVNSAEGVRIAMLVSKKLIADYPYLRTWESVYVEIEANIVNAVNYSMSKNNMKPLITNGDLVFSDDELPADKIFETWIAKGNYIEEAKRILGVQK
jgi:hypothetical protein